MPTLEFRWKVGGVLTDATAVLLSDPTGTFGVKRDDTGAIVVADSAAMDHFATGVYRYEFTAPAEDLSYSWWAEVTYGGTTYRFEFDQLDGDASTPTAAEMVALIKNALRSNPVGVVRVTVDGQDIEYGRAQALNELRFWQKIAGNEDGTRPRAMRIRLDGF